MAKRYDAKLGWVDDDKGLAHARDLDAWVRGDGVVRFKDGRVTVVDSLDPQQRAEAQEAQRRASKLKSAAAPAVAPLKTPAGALPAPPALDQFKPLVHATNAMPPQPKQPAMPAPRGGGDLAAFAQLLRGGS